MGSTAKVFESLCHDQYSLAASIHVIMEREEDLALT